MKKTLLAWTLLLVMLGSLVSCSLGNGGDTDTSGSTDAVTTGGSETEEEDVPHTIYGFWYSDVTAGVLEVQKDSQTAKFYSLATGYYEYYMVDDGTYTLSEDGLTLYLYDQKYQFVFDADENTLTLGSYVYHHQASAPSEHPVYSFPNFEELSKTVSVTLPNSYKNEDLKTAYTEEAGIKIFLDYYSTSMESYPEITDRPAKRGDYVNVSYIGYLDGIPFEGGSATETLISVIENVYNVDGVSYIDGFVEGIIGHTSGETFDVAVTFPENYGVASMAGKDVIFKMTLNAVYDVRLTEEQFAHLEGIDYETYDDYVQGYAAVLAATPAVNAIVHEVGLLDLIPETSYLYFYQYYLDYAHYMSAMYGMTYDNYMNLTGQSEDVMLVQAKNVAADYIMAYLISRAEQVEWTEEAYQKQFDSFVKELVDTGNYTQEEAETFVKENQMTQLYTELCFSVISEWVANQIFQT